MEDRPSHLRKTAPRARETLTVKQRKLLANKLDGQSSSQAARNAGHSESVSRHAERIMDSPKMKPALDELLETARR